MDAGAVGARAGRAAERTAAGRAAGAVRPRSGVVAGWAGAAVRVRCVHLRAFGNVNYKRDGAPAQLRDVALGVRNLVAKTRPMLGTREPIVVLLCACRRRVSRHRSTAALKLVRQLGAEDMAN